MGEFDNSTIGQFANDGIDGANVFQRSGVAIGHKTNNGNLKIANRCDVV
ncbi:hypothetical protein [Flavipsychrobacter stenotrophus]|nr:hypothetical protein [Flavipsychrobacter stenotrophus]